MEDGERDDVGTCGHGEDEELMQGEVVLDDPGEGGSAECSGCTADADDGGDGGGGEHVGGSGEEIGAPALMRGGGERDEQRRGPGVRGEQCAHVRHEDDGENAKRGDEHGGLASVVDRHAAIHEPAGEGSSEDGADGGDEVHGDDVPVGVREREAIVAIEELGEIEEIEPPDAVGESLGEGEGVEAAVAEEGAIERLSCGDGLEVLLGEGGSAAELVVWEGEPDDEPDHAERAGGEEGRLPAEAGGDPGDESGSDEGGGVGSGVEEADGLGALFGGEPLGDGLDGGGEVAGFS